MGLLVTEEDEDELLEFMLKVGDSSRALSPSSLGLDVSIYM